jgi:IS30 family transposase
MTQKFSHLSREQRYKIEALKTAGFSQTKIAEQIGVHKSTICREIKRNAIARAKPPDKYKANQAQLFAEKRAYKPWSHKTTNKAIRRRIIWLLKHDWSPEQIAHTCKRRGIEMLSTEAIYLWIYTNRKQGHTDLVTFLRRGHRKRRKRRLTNQPRVIIKEKVSIHDRPELINKQERLGDFEADLVKCTNGYFITITERKSLFNFIVKIPSKNAEIVEQKLIDTLRPYKGKIHSITSDNGTEFARFKKVVEALGIKWFFADAYCSQQRGCNENQNGLLRQYFKNKTDLSSISDQDVLKIQNKLNSRPRKKNNFISPSKFLSLHKVAFDT